MDYFRRFLPNEMLFAVFLLLISLDVTEESQFRVKTLPGFTGELPITLETGYIGVGESDDVQLFYYFIESEENPKEDPLIFWLTGGPGCSGLSSLMYEIGPLAINYVDSTSEKTVLEINPYSWTKVANIIFVDQPAGSGFAYGKTPEAYMTNDTLSTFHTYTFIKKWLVDHPKFLSNPLYVGGESYEGIVLPIIVQEIYKGLEVGDKPHINMKGYLLGNPFTDLSMDPNSRIQYANHMALLSDAIYESVKENCKGEYMKVDTNNRRCVHDLGVVNKCLERIYPRHILYPVCDNASTSLLFDLFRRDLRALDNIIMPQVEKQWCREDNFLYAYVWANNIDVQKALHVHEVFDDIKWVRCNNSIRFSDEMTLSSSSYTNNVQSVVDYHLRLTDKKCRSLVFSGDHDLTVPYLGTMNWIESLNLSVKDDWRPWFVEEQVAGYTVKYMKDDYELTFATVKGGGHTSPEFKPKECLGMFMKWLAGNSL